MSLPLHTPTRVSLRLEAPNDTAVNLVKGLSDHVYFCARNDEDKAVTLTIPGFQLYRVTDTYITHCFDFMVAFAQGTFQLKELGTGSSISLDNSKVADSEAPQPTHLVISPRATVKYILLHRGSRLLCCMGLRAGISYVLSFNDPSGKIKCKFSTLEEEAYFKEEREIPTATLHSDGREHSALFESTGQPIQIQVVPGTPLPRFQMSFQLSSSLCNLSGSPSFFLRLVMKSLEPRPVTLYMEGTPWLYDEGLDDIASLVDVATHEEIELPYMNWCFDEDRYACSHVAPIEDYKCFEEGSEWTCERKFQTTELNRLRPDRNYMVKFDDFGFPRWRYGKVCDPQNTSMEKNEDGVIWPEIVEATPTFASIVEKTMEAGGTGPFHRLPRELRKMIYKNLEATETDVLYFRTKAGP